MSLISRILTLEKEAQTPNNCPGCKGYNSAVYFATMLMRSGKHCSEAEIPEFKCPVCEKAPKRTVKEDQEDYSRMIVDFRNGRPLWEVPTNEQQFK